MFIKFIYDIMFGYIVNIINEVLGCKIGLFYLSVRLRWMNCFVLKVSCIDIELCRFFWIYE